MTTTPLTKNISGMEETTDKNNDAAGVTMEHDAADDAKMVRFLEMETLLKDKEEELRRQRTARDKELLAKKAELREKEDQIQLLKGLLDRTRKDVTYLTGRVKCAEGKDAVTPDGKLRDKLPVWNCHFGHNDDSCQSSSDEEEDDDDDMKPEAKNYEGKKEGMDVEIAEAGLVGETGDGNNDDDDSVLSVYDSKDARALKAHAADAAERRRLSSASN